MEAILGHFFVNFGVRLIVVVDAILGVVVAFWLSFWEDAGIDFWYHLVAFFFACKCYPRRARGFSLPVLGVICGTFFKICSSTFDAGETENTTENWRFTGASKNKHKKSRHEDLLMVFDEKSEIQITYVFSSQNRQKNNKKKEPTLQNK